MAKTSIQNMLAVVDPLKTFQWDLAFPRIPGVSDSRPLSVKCVGTSIPGTSIEPISWEGHGMRLHFSGRRVFDETWEATIIESRDSTTRDSLISWMELVRSWRANSGAYKAQYAVPAEISLYDDANTVVRGIKLINVFPSQIGQITLDQGSSIVQYQATFSIDYFEEA